MGAGESLAAEAGFVMRQASQSIHLRSHQEIPMQLQLTAVFQEVREGYIGFVEELPGANTQGATLAEARANLEEALHLVLAANRTLAEEQLRGQTVIREPLCISAA